MTKKRTLLTSACLAAVIIAVGWVAVDTIYGSASAKSATRTTTVQMGTVQSTVTATGNVSPASALSVNFQTSGTVTEIDVKAGDPVKAGQTLAKIDDAQTQAALSSAQASLTSAQANLTNVQQPLTAAAAAQNAAALQSGQQAVATAQAGVGSAQQSAALNAVGYQNTVNQAQAQQNRDTNQFTNDQANCVTPTTSASGSGGGQSCTTQLAADQSAIAKDRDSVTNANQQQATGQLKDQQSIQQAQNSLISAEDNLASTVASNNAKASATPASVAQAQAQVITAQAGVVTAQKNEAATTLTAPSDGTVATLSGIVGQTVSGGGTSASSTSSGGAATGASASSSSSSAFITLDNVSALEVVAGFAEADASKVQVGQAATISLNALPNQTLDGQVSRVDVTSTVVSNVVTYNVTITLANPPTGVKPGMTASVAVVVSQRDNVLNLPTADISTRGGASSVTLLRSGKQIVQTVTTGLVGDQTTEIISGVSQGDTVVTPTVSITGTGTGTGATRTGTGTGGIGGGGAGAGGGGFLGGGGGCGGGAGGGG
jgi:HlyD family secretion protein